MNDKFIKLTKRGDGLGILVRAQDIINVTDEGNFRIIRYMVDGVMQLEHVKDELDSIVYRLS